MGDRQPLDEFRANVRLDPRRRERITARVAERIRRSAADDDGRRPFDGRPPLDVPQPDVSQPDGPQPSTRVPPSAPTAPGEPERDARPLVAAAAVAIVLLVLAGTAGLRHSGTAIDRLTVDDLAATARQGPERTLDDGEHLFHAEERLVSGSREGELAERWIAADGTGHERRQLSAPGARPPLEPSPAPPSSLPSEAMDFAGLSYDELRGLPTDPSALLDRLMELDQVDDRRSGDMVLLLAELLTFDVTPAPVRGAALNALGLLGGEVRGVARDARGRHGVAVSGRSRDGLAWTVVIDPASGRAIAANTTRPDPRTRPTSTPSWQLWFPGAGSGT